MEPTPQSLLQRLHANPKDIGSGKRFADIYDPFLIGCLGRWYPGMPVEDIVEEIRLEIVKGLPNFNHNGNVGAFRKWLRVVVQRTKPKIEKRLKRQLFAQQAPEYLDNLVDDNSELSRQFDEEHNRFVINKLLEAAEPHFSKRDLEIFAQHVLKEIPATQLSEQFAVSVAYVYVIKNKILKWLREEGHGIIEQAE